MFYSVIFTFSDRFFPYLIKEGYGWTDGRTDGYRLLLKMSQLCKAKRESEYDQSEDTNPNQPTHAIN